MNKKNRPSPEYILSRISYAQLSGKLIWKARGVERPSHNQWNARFAGKEAGSKESDGYIRVGLSGGRFHAHIIAWCIMAGEWPAHLIDHKDCDPSNNRWTNLRAATASQNGHNSRVAKNNSSGIKGVRYIGAKRLWQARVAKDGTRHLIGYFKTPEQAKIARDSAAVRLHGEFARSA